MSVTVYKSWFIGLGILILFYLVWFIALQLRQYSEVLVFLLWMSPLVAAFISAYLSPRNKILVGVSMVFPTAILSVTLNILSQLFGNAVDFPGFRGGLILFANTIVYGGILCGIGAIGGSFLNKKIDSAINER